MKTTPQESVDEAVQALDKIASGKFSAIQELEQSRVARRYRRKLLLSNLPHLDTDEDDSPQSQAQAH
ncbi:MAG TPA: hypothetical protein VF085_05025 [Solirubrobacterales bacterium]